MVLAPKASPKGKTPSSTPLDSPWKLAIERYFEAFLALLFPAAHADIDWQRGFEFLDREFEQIMRGASVGDRRADKLARVWRKGGDQASVFIHVEVEAQTRDTFAERMHVYNYRTYDRHRRPVVSLAVLADRTPDWRPDRWGYSLWGCDVGMRFPVVKLLDYNDRWAELDTSLNPFATVVMAHLKAMATRRSPQSRLRWKLALVTGLYEKGFGRKDVIQLFTFIDWVMTLPEPAEKSFEEEITQYEKERKVEYVTSIERIGMQKGMQKGGVSVLRRQLARKFGSLPRWVDERLEAADLETLDRWAEQLLDARELEDVFRG